MGFYGQHGHYGRKWTIVDVKVKNRCKIVHLVHHVHAVHFVHKRDAK